MQTRTGKIQAALLASSLAGCSLSGLDQVPCQTNPECRDSFGYGYYCADDGFCELTEGLERCDLYPEGASLPLDPAETVLLASMFVRSNETHLARIQSVRLAAMQANENGGLEGRDVAVLECTIEANAEYDDLDQQGAVEAIATKLAGEVGVPAIVGPASSSDVEVAYNAVAPFGDTLVISPSATSPALIDLDGITASDEDPGMLWRTAAPDSLQGEVIAADMTTRGIGSVAVIYQQGAYGDGLQQIFAESFGGTEQLLPFSDATGRDQAVANAADAGVDSVLFISSEVDDIVGFLNAASVISGYDEMPIFLTDAAATATVLTQASSASDLFDQIRGTRPSIPSGNLYDTFAGSFGAAYSGKDASSFSFTAHSYDAAWLVIYGSAWAEYQGEPGSGVDFARGLRRVSGGAGVDIRSNTWNTVKASFEAGVGIDVVGTSGQLDYDAASEETTAPIDVWTIAPEGDAIIVDYATE